jgi:hypothetical protein
MYQNSGIKGVKGHLYYDLVDAAVNDDNLLLIDPLLN